MYMMIIHIILRNTQNTATLDVIIYNHEISMIKVVYNNIVTSEHQPYNVYEITDGKMYGRNSSVSNI